MNVKTLCLVTLMICVKTCVVGADADITDFSFDNEDPNPGSDEEYDNDVDYEEEEQPKQEVSKDSMVRQFILNSMKSQEMKDKVARVLPILRVMTPDQKLALASLVTTQVLTPPTSKGLTLDEVSTLFGNNPNATADLMLPISLDVANMFRRARSEKGPIAEELRGAPPFKFRPLGVFRRNTIERPHNKYMRPRKPIKPNNAGNANKEPPNCELFSSSVCLTSHDYPIEAIMSSIRRNKHAMTALLTDFKVVSTDSIVDSVTQEPEDQHNNDEESGNEVRRTGAESGYMCPSIVRYARPQKARATSGQWKYIVNTADHTQTLRLERCLKPLDTCTYLTDNFKSRCVQVYNYHRLLTWDQANGLHMDIFKVPTCCSCHIDSYKVPFPPHHANHATTSEHFPGEDIEHELPATTPLDTDHFVIHATGSHRYKEPTFPTRHSDYADLKYQSESTKVRPSVENRPNLPKYLEAPKPQSPPSKPIYNHNYKRSNPPKPFSPPNKRPSRPVRRRPSAKPVRDLAQSESSFSQYTTDSPTSSSSPVMKDYTRKINYNYHPIIDFFKPDQLESRMDIDLGDSDWRPVTSMILPTERTPYQKR